MKIECTNCGKRYDYDIYSGICPKCGTLHRQINSEQNSTITQETGSTTQEKTKSKQNSAKKTAVKTQKPQRKSKHGSSYYKISILLVLAIIITATIPLSVSRQSSKQAYDALSLTELPEPIEVAIGETFTYQEEYAALDITITDVSIDTDERFQLPDGYEIVTVSYQTYAYNTPDYPENLYGGYLYYLRTGITPYLVTKNREYLPALNPLDIEDIKDYDYDETTEKGISDKFYYDKGILYFLVKEQDAAGLWINCNEYDPVNAELLKLTQIFEIKNMEVTR